ncbi:MAG: hypothetical protein AMXMBFR84_40130 [Candidatus Hydrogenedentota bacterium]
MRKCRRFALISIVLLFGVSRDSRAVEPVRGARLHPHRPITVAASTEGRFGEGMSWWLSVNSAGQAELTIEGYPERQRRRFEVTQEHLDALHAMVEKEAFFELARDQGEVVFDGSTQTVTIVIGDKANTVHIRYLMNWVQSDHEKLSEPARALRVFMLIRGWFDDENAVDLSKYDQMVLDAVEK